jgi:endonuclease III
MNASNRSALITKSHAVLKKHYKPVLPPTDRSVIEHLLYAGVLEDARFEAADEAFAKLHQYFDWNEVRVTTVAELAEVLSHLPDASNAAVRVKNSLQGIFESHYSFDLEFLVKQNQGKSIKDLEKYKGSSPFIVAYVIQNALGGHSIAVDKNTLEVLHILGIISEQELKKYETPGLERAIPKNKGPEYFSLLHQFSADYSANPNSTKFKQILIEIDSEIKERLPKWLARKQVLAQEAVVEAVKQAERDREKAEKEKKALETPKTVKGDKGKKGDAPIPITVKPEKAKQDQAKAAAAMQKPIGKEKPVAKETKPAASIPKKTPPAKPTGKDAGAKKKPPGKDSAKPKEKPRDTATKNLQKKKPK